MSTAQPLVSIIMPTYNRPEYIREAIESAINQTYTNFELIISDNCSPQDPKPIIDSFNDSRIRYFRNTVNVGMFPNTMQAFKLAKGKYVASLHDDDRWKENFLEKLVPRLEENPKLVVAFSNQFIIDTQGKVDNEITEKYSQKLKRNELKEGVYTSLTKIGLVNLSIQTASAAVIRNEYIDWDSIPAEVGGMWDVYLTYLCCRTGMGAYYCPDKLTFYRMHSQSDSLQDDLAGKIRKARTQIACYSQFVQDELVCEFRSYFQMRLLHAHTTLGIGLLKAEELDSASTNLHYTFKRNRSNVRNLAALVLSLIPRPLTKVRVKVLKILVKAA